MASHPLHGSLSDHASIDNDRNLSDNVLADTVHQPVDCSHSETPKPAKVRKPDEVYAEPDRATQVPEWRPRWLHPVILGAFSVLFAIIVAVLAFITVYSRRNDGLADAHDNMAYVWRFGPTACKLYPTYSVWPAFQITDCLNLQCLLSYRYFGPELSSKSSGICPGSPSNKIANLQISTT